MLIARPGPGTGPESKKRLASQRKNSQITFESENAYRAGEIHRCLPSAHSKEPGSVWSHEPKGREILFLSCLKEDEKGGFWGSHESWG